MKAINCFIRFCIVNVKHKIAKCKQPKSIINNVYCTICGIKSSNNRWKKKNTMPCMLYKHDIGGTKSTEKLHTEFKVSYKLLPYTPKFTLHRIVVFKLKFCV